MAEMDSTATTPPDIELALKFLGEEHETLWALSTALVHNLEPNDPNDPETCSNVLAWRLAGLLQERLASTRFQENMGWLLHGSPRENVFAESLPS